MGHAATQPLREGAGLKDAVRQARDRADPVGRGPGRPLDALGIVRLGVPTPGTSAPQPTFTRNATARAVMKALTVLLAVLLSWAPPAPGAAQERPFSFAGEGFFALQVADVDEMAGWYSHVLGLERLTAVDDDARGVHIRILSDGTVGLELIEARDREAPPQQHRGLFKAGLFVTDIHAAHDWMLDLGAEVDPRPVTDTAMQVITFVLRDPEGNRVQFFETCRSPC